MKPKDVKPLRSHSNPPKAMTTSSSISSNLSDVSYSSKFQINHPSPAPEKSSFTASREAKRLEQFSNILSTPVIDINKIRDISWAGIPSKFRAQTWRLFLDYEPVNSAIRSATLQHKRIDYFDCVSRVFSDSQKKLWSNAQVGIDDQIMLDIPRMRLPIIHHPRIKLLFERVLFVWAVRHPASGYVQGMNDVLQPFFLAFLLELWPDFNYSQTDPGSLSPEQIDNMEADCFWCFSKLLDGLQDLYTKDQPGIIKMLNSLSHVIDRMDPELGKHIDDESISYQEFAFKWVNCLLVREFSPPILFKLWDSYLANPTKISTSHVYVCAAILLSQSKKLLPLSHPDFVMELQNISPDDWTDEEMEEIIAQAYVFDKMFTQAQSHLRSASVPNFSDAK